MIMLKCKRIEGRFESFTTMYHIESNDIHSGLKLLIQLHFIWKIDQALKSVISDYDTCTFVVMGSLN